MFYTCYNVWLCVIHVYTISGNVFLMHQIPLVSYPVAFQVAILVSSSFRCIQDVRTCSTNFMNFMNFHPICPSQCVISYLFNFVHSVCPWIPLIVSDIQGTVLSPPNVPSKPSRDAGFNVRHLLSADKLPKRGHLDLSCWSSCDWQNLEHSPNCSQKNVINDDKW